MKIYSDKEPTGGWTTGGKPVRYSGRFFVIFGLEYSSLYMLYTYIYILYKYIQNSYKENVIEFLHKMIIKKI